MHLERTALPELPCLASVELQTLFLLRRSTIYVKMALFFPVFGPAPNHGESIGARTPYLMVGFLILTTYSVVWRFAVEGLILGRLYGIQSPHFNDLYQPTGPIIAGVALVLLTTISKVMWVGAWAYALLITHCTQRHHNPVTSLKRVMASDSEERKAVEDGHPASNIRFRRCGRDFCLDRKPYGDRVYHCSKTDCHYPIYDHYCHWLWVAVYLDTMKPYLCLIFWIAVDGIVCMAASIAAATLARTGLGLLHWIVAVCSGLQAIYMAVIVGITQFKWLAFRNVVPAELKERFNDWTMVRTVDTTHGKRVQFVTLFRTQEDKDLKWNFNPWYLSPSENFRQCLGESAWTWPFFWIQSRRVRQYGKSPTMESDLPLGPLWRRFEREAFDTDCTWTDYLPMPPIARSSGVELA